MKKNRFFKIFINSFCVFTSIISITFGIYLSISYSNLENSSLIKRLDNKPSRIFDNNENVIQSIGKEEESIEYEDLPSNLIAALTSIEDTSFFAHNGIDIKRIFSSFLNNIFSNSIQGGSTLTQQLAKNMFLTSDRTLERKIKEMLLSFKLESKYDKKTILEFYFNNVYFDPVIPGIAYASQKFFNKKVNSLSLAESALLAGLVKSPTLYEPTKHEENCNKRKNLVLSAMLKNNVISKNEYEHSIKLTCEDLIYKRKSDITSYAYQAYLDATYQECKKLTGIDPYRQTISIYTYLEPQIQKVIDSIQDESEFSFYDDLQQFGAALIDNSTGHVVALAGGREYNGKKIFNRGYDKLVNPASTIKPIFEYLLAIDLLGYNKATTLNDEETTYLNGEKLSNANDHYSGKLPLLDAIGYSKNTTAIQTLNSLTRLKGERFLSEYLSSINLNDGGYTESYGLGGMKNGVNLVNLAASYQVIANDGIYNKPSFIKKIVDSDGKVLYQDQQESKRIVSSETSYIMKDILENLVNKGYSSLDQVRINNIAIGAKTGTGQYPSSVINKYHYPRSADRDSLVVGFSLDFTLAVWTGFDKPELDKKTYFYNGDKRKTLTKRIFKKIMSAAAKSGLNSKVPDNIFSPSVVKYADDLYYPNELIPDNYTMMTHINGYKDIKTYPLPNFDSFDGTILEYEDYYEVQINNNSKEDELYRRIYGPLGTFIKVDDQIYFTTGKTYQIAKSFLMSNIEIYEGYENLANFHSEPIQFNIDFNIFDF